MNCVHLYIFVKNQIIDFIVLHTGNESIDCIVLHTRNLCSFHFLCVYVTVCVRVCVGCGVCDVCFFVEGGCVCGVCLCVLCVCGVCVLVVCVYIYIKMYWNTVFLISSTARVSQFCFIKWKTW